MDANAIEKQNRNSEIEQLKQELKKLKAAYETEHDEKMEALQRYLHKLITDLCL